jgi:hypothetical protein
MENAGSSPRALESLIGEVEYRRRAGIGLEAAGRRRSGLRPSPSRTTGLAVVTPEAEDGIAVAIRDGLMFYDRGTPTREWVADEPPQRAVRGWLWEV